MNVNFSPQEEIAIKQMAQMDDLSEEKIVIQAIRMYQLWKMNRIKLIWPKVIEHKLYEADIPMPKAPADTPETVQQVDIVA